MTESLVAQVLSHEPHGTSFMGHVSHTGAQCVVRVESAVQRIQRCPERIAFRDIAHRRSECEREGFYGMADAMALPRVNDASPAAPNQPSAAGDACDGETAPLFSVLIDRWGDEIYRFTWHLTGNPADADDLYQETLLKAFRAYRKLPADANHRAWLYRIASNTFISDRRKHGRVNPMNDVMEASLPAPGVDQARRLDARDLLQEVEAFVADLPPKQRVALVLRKYHGHDYAHIAMTLKCSEEAARANVHEALRKVRSRFSHRMEA